MRKLTIVLAVLQVLGAADLPVRRVLLYKHGVGFLEREGNLRPGETARLDFKAAEMNDVLKSLTIVDRSGAKVAGVRYDASEALDIKLQNYPFQGGAITSLSTFLNQLRGAPVELKLGGETITGNLVSARETMQARPSGGTESREQVVLLTSAGDLRTLDLSAVTSVRLAEPELQRQLTEFLQTVAQSRSREKRSVYIDSTGNAQRELTASYLVPMPVWKSSYRLILGTPKTTLEGWAIVDNTTGEDWSKVQLSLVSGRPISFISQLYEPRYRNRPTADLPEDAAQTPVVYESANAQVEVRASAGFAGGVMGGIAGGRPGSMPAPPPEFAKRDNVAARRLGGGGNVSVQSTVADVADSGETGELFEYRFATPVTVKKSESAMLPFLQQTIDARKLLIYSELSSIHPRNAVELANNTGKTLDGGPLTVFDEGTYAGEALVETVKEKDKRLIAYAVDLGTRVNTKTTSAPGVVREVHFARGELTTRTSYQETRTYTANNVDAKPKTLLIEHPLRPDFKLTGTQPIETTQRAYRFEVKLPASGAAVLSVAEERLLEESTSVTNLIPETLLVYSQNKSLPAAARQGLQQIAAKKRQISDVESQLRQNQQDSQAVIEDQNRMRQNVQTLNGVGGRQNQVQQYADTLAANETKLTDLRAKQQSLRAQKMRLDAELNTLLEQLVF